MSHKGRAPRTDPSAQRTFTQAEIDRLVQTRLARYRESRVWSRVDDLLERYDASVDIEGGTAAAWAGQLRLTLTNPEGAPSRSIVFYSAGGLDPDEVAEALLADAEAWLAESEQKPLPPPAWMLGDGEGEA